MATLVDEFGEEYQVKQGISVIGRRRDCDIVIPAPVENGHRNPERFHPKYHTVSRKHAKLVLRDEDAALMDLDSSYGTTVNGISVRSKDHIRLFNGDEIYFGHLRLHYVATGYDNSVENIAINLNSGVVQRETD